LKSKLVDVIFKNSGSTWKRTPHFTITNINWLTLFKEMIPVYTIWAWYKTCKYKMWSHWSVTQVSGTYSSHSVGPNVNPEKTEHRPYVCVKGSTATRHGGAWGKRRYSSYSFTTSTLDWGSSPPGKGPPVPIGQEAGWAPEPVWTLRLEEKSFVPAEDRTSIARSSSQ
jgi:hypothetical protein